MPYPEHGEFVIVGVFAVDATRRNITWKIQDTLKTKRMTAFFPELDRNIFTDALTNLRKEWKMIADMVSEQKGARTEALALDGPTPQDLYAALTHPREGMVRQKKRGTILTEDIDEWINDAFLRMVLRQEPGDAVPEEKTLVTKVKNLLNLWHVGKAWQEQEVGKGGYHAKFPLAYKPEGQNLVQRVIKPLFLAQPTATKIIDHGDTWLQKIRRLKQFDVAPERIMFPVHLPIEDNDELRTAAECVMKDIRDEGIETVPHNRLERLRDFAQVACATDGAPIFEKNGSL